MYCSCRKRHVAESIARERLKNHWALRALQTASGEKKKHSTSSCWLWFNTALDRKETLEQGKKWPLICDCYLTLPNSLPLQPCLLKTPLIPTYFISCAVLFALAAIKNSFTGKTWHPASRGLWTPQLYKYRAKPYKPGCTTKGPVSKAFYQAQDSQAWPTTEGTCS